MDLPSTRVFNATVVRLLLASFLVAMATMAFIFAVPFYMLAQLDNRADAVGLVVATWTAGYIASCLLSQRLSQSVSPRVLVTLATIGVGIFVYVFRYTHSLTQMSAIALCYGLSLGQFWPPLMGWLSGDAEGVILSRRLSWFNTTWSSGIILSPPLVGYLVKHYMEMSFVVAMLGMLAACVVVLTTRRLPDRGRVAPTGVPSQPSGQMKVEPASLTDSSPTLDPVKMRYIRYFGWSGAVIAYLSVAVYRFQMPHLATTIHMDKIVFGWVMTALATAITASFFLTTRWTSWHGKTRWIFMPQMVLVLVSAMLTWATTAWIMIPLVAVGGICAGLLYTSSVFYGSLGAPPEHRTRRMAIHEVCLNVGVITGSYFGNLLSQHLGPSRVYPYLAAASAIAVVIQMGLWNVLLLRSRVTPMAPVREGGA